MEGHKSGRQIEGIRTQTVSDQTREGISNLLAPLGGGRGERATGRPCPGAHGAGGSFRAAPTPAVPSQRYCWTGQGDWGGGHLGFVGDFCLGTINRARKSVKCAAITCLSSNDADGGMTLQTAAKRNQRHVMRRNRELRAGVCVKVVECYEFW